MSESSQTRINLVHNDKRNGHFMWAIPSQETVAERKDRYSSIRLCYFVMFLSSVSFTISISSMWPFLQEIDKTANTAFFGFVVSFFSIGQLISSPLFGLWASKMRYHKLPIIIALIILILGNLIYLYLERVDELTTLISPKYWMLLARFIMGTGAACAAVIRAYVASASSVEERTGFLANISAFQAIGFIIGPLIQVAFVPIDYPSKINFRWLPLNMYTAPAAFSAIIYAIILAIIAFKFNEYVVISLEDLERSRSQLANVNEDLPQKFDVPDPDYFAIALTLLLFFLNCFVFSFFESVTSPMTIDMYGWTKKEATLYNGVIIGVFGTTSVLIFILTKVLIKRFKENTLLLAGFFILFLSTFALISWGSDYPNIEIAPIFPAHKNSTFSTTTSTPFIFNSTVEPRGCPYKYEWCQDTPNINFIQFLAAMLLLTIGYSFANIMSFAIFSKLQPTLKPQGLMMGFLTSAGSSSRAIGPIVVTLLYESYGHRVCFIFLTGLMLITNLLIVLTFKRYKPYSSVTRPE